MASEATDSKEKMATSLEDNMLYMTGSYRSVEKMPVFT